MKRIVIVLAFLAASIAHAEVNTELPVKVYVLVGQSNMQGKGGIESEEPGSLRYMVNNDPNKEFQFLVDSEGQWIERRDVWINLGEMSSGLKPGYGSQRAQIGPELGFGHLIGDVYEGQVLLIKTCWGGKSLGNDFLPPSVGKYPIPERPGEPGYYYNEILRIVKDVTENIGAYFPDYKGQGIEIAGLCFHQGWNDQYGGLDVFYEKNLAAFIKDIRSSGHGLGVPDLPVVIATSGLIEKDTPIKAGQLAMGDAEKYPEFDGNVSVVDTEKPYGQTKMQFKFYTKNSPDKVSYHWNNHANSYMNIGRAMAEEMKKMAGPALPSRLVAYGAPEGVQLTWQLGSEKPKSVELRRNGKWLNVSLQPTKTTFLDETALPGRNDYELVLTMPKSPEQKLTAGCDTSVTDFRSYRSKAGVMLNWEARGKYDGFKIQRDGKLLAERVNAESRSYEDTEAPEKGMVTYSIEPTNGNATPAVLTVNLGPIDPGDALVYEPFDYPADPATPLSLVGKTGAVGTKGAYFIVQDSKPDRMPAVLAGGLAYGDLPVTGNRAASARWSAGCAIELDDSLHKAGLLEDGATLWISWVFCVSTPAEHRQGGGMFTLSTSDFKEGVGLKADTREFQTVVILDGKPNAVRITSSRVETPTLVVGKIVWGKDGEDDSFVPYTPGYDLKQPEEYGRKSAPFNIDQSKIKLLHLQGEGVFDEIRVGPTYESVVGGGTVKAK